MEAKHCADVLRKAFRHLLSLAAFVTGINQRYGCCKRPVKWKCGGRFFYPVLYWCSFSFNVEADSKLQLKDVSGTLIVLLLSHWYLWIMKHMPQRVCCALQ